MIILLNSFPALYILQGAARLGGAIVPILSIYVLWVLKTRYAD